MTQGVYDQLDATFQDVSVYFVMKGEDYVARVIFKRSVSDGSVTCFLQVWGSAMVKGVARGYGYSKRDAAFRTALARAPKADYNPPTTPAQEHCAEMKRVTNGGSGAWQGGLEGAGYTVHPVI